MAPVIEAVLVEAVVVGVAAWFWLLEDRYVSAASTVVVGVAVLSML